MDAYPGEISVLKRLRLFVPRLDTLKRVWKDLLSCLRENTSVIHLDLSKSELDDEAFRDVMDLLQVNLTLQEIDVSETSWAKDGKAAPIHEALKQNMKRADYMKVFRDAKLTFGDAKAGRLLLCGSPRAGKTKLRQTLMRIVQGKTWLGNKWEALWRTKCIEVELLQNNERSQISIWDFARQEIFLSVPNMLFPQTSNFCVFLFVYNPFDEKTSCIKPESCFQTELNNWLSFITSNSRARGHNLPQVLVVISHKDKVRSTSLTWAHAIVEAFTRRFANFVDLHPIAECSHVDARKKKQVIPLKNHIFEIFEKLLREKSPRVPHLCHQLTSLLVTKTKKKKTYPIWSSQKFHDFCDSSLKHFIPTYSAHYVDHSSIMSSLISYLNDVGFIIYIPNLDYIIVDPNWLTNTFFSEVLTLGQHFQAQESDSFEAGESESFDEVSPYTSKEGFVSDSVFASWKEEFLRKQPPGQKGVNSEVLENILINLDLCFKLEDISQYLIPSLIPEHASMEIHAASMHFNSESTHLEVSTYLNSASTMEQKHQEVPLERSMYWENTDETSQFVGIRIQCQDKRTMSLTAAFFPSFQMFMRRKLISEMHVSKESVICSPNYLRLLHDGHEIYVENVQSDESHKYVDVLMLCSKHKSREEALKYLMKHIVQELISFCASPKGCPRVALVLGVIQTLCVKMLIPSHLRGAILIEDLKSRFIRSIEDKLEDIPLDTWHLEKEEELFNYEHGWTPIRRHAGEISERARDLLLESDVEAVVNEIQRKRIQQLESLQECLLSLNNDSTQCYPEVENMFSNLSLREREECKSITNRLFSRASTSVENRSTRLLLFKIDQLEQKVDRVDEKLRSKQRIVERLDNKLGEILSLQRELESMLSDFMSKVDRRIDYSQELQQATTPKRPYVTDELGLFHRMSDPLHVGQTVRLHLMCEYVTRFHTVKDQEGLDISLDQENSSWIQKTIEISYKVMHYMVKAGLDVNHRLGQAIPDWDWRDLKSNILSLDGISEDDCRAFLKGGESKELQEAWLRFQETVAPELQDSYSAIFNLYQVKYVRLELGGHAWMCEECLNKGLSSGVLTY